MVSPRRSIIPTAPIGPVNTAVLFAGVVSPPANPAWNTTRPVRLIAMYCELVEKLPENTAPAVPGAGFPSRATRVKPPGKPPNRAESLAVVEPEPQTKLGQNVRPSGLKR